MREVEQPIRVLVVDDDEGMATTLCDILDASGYVVDVAYSGYEAMDLARENRPDCILMDLRMPDLNGVEAFRELKRLTPESFVIFMTAYAQSTLVEDAHREGAIDVVPKPLDLGRVLALIEETAAQTAVLVVDDDTSFCKSLGDALTEHQFDVHAAATLDDAIRRFEKEPRRVVILDMKLNGQNGLDALLRIKELNPRAIVILITGFSDLWADMSKGLRMTATACFLKPFDVAELVRTIREAVDELRYPEGRAPSQPLVARFSPDSGQA